MTRQLWYALICAALATLLVFFYLAQHDRQWAKQSQPLRVVVANRNISSGEPLTADMFDLAEIPSAYVMPGAFTPANPAQDEMVWKKIHGHFAIAAIQKGEQLLHNKVSRNLPGVAQALAEGKRLMALSLASADLAGGHIRPGQYIDIIASFTHTLRGQTQTSTVCLVQHVLVATLGEQTLAQTGKNSKQQVLLGDNSQQVIGLALAPADALRLALAEQEGRIKLLLRPEGDEQILDLADQNVGTVLGPLLRVRAEDIRQIKAPMQIIQGRE
jgi:pilus assembly protein CpaB